MFYCPLPYILYCIIIFCKIVSLLYWLVYNYSHLSDQGWNLNKTRQIIIHSIYQNHLSSLVMMLFDILFHGDVGDYADWMY